MFALATRSLDSIVFIFLLFFKLCQLAV